MHKSGKIKSLSLKTLPKIIKLAYRNLYRNKRRTMIAIFIAASGCAAMCIAVGYYAFSIYSLEEMTIRNGFSGSGGSAHIQVTDKRMKAIQGQQSLEFGITDAQKIMERIRQMPEVDYVMPRIAFGGLISNGEETFPYIGYGIHAEEESRLRGGLSDIDPRLKVGEQIYPLTNGATGVILGRSLANSLEAEIGDMLLIYSTTTSGAVNALDVELLGIMSTGISETDKYYLLTNTGIAQNLLATDKISSINVMFKDRDNLNQKIFGLNSMLRNEFPNIEFIITDWTDQGEYYRSIRDIFNIIFTFMGSIITIIVLLSCWNIMNVTTMERMKEIGTLRAIGLKVKSIGNTFLIEAIFIGMIGVVLGLLVQYGIATIVNGFKIIMPPIPGMNQGYTLQVYSLTRYQPFIAIGMILIIALSSLSSFFVIKKYTIVESLEHT